MGRRKDGGLFPAEATFSLLRDAGGSAFGIVRVFRDIARRKEIERMKSEFVSLVSHELRTPLTAIQGFSETILDYGDELTEEKRRTYMNIIVDESKRLGALVTNFLDISKLEAGGMEMLPEDVPLPPLLERLKSLFRDHPSKAVLKTSVGPDAARVHADPEQLYRILLNLCGNALRYSPPGGTVEIASRSDGAWIEISVDDQGPGIPADQQDRLFQKFSRLTDDVSRKSKGTGLGLSICKAIVEAHGGRIWVESAPGRGTSFKFTLPAPRS